MLDILEDYLELRRVGYGRLDGAMPFGERQRQMAVFQGDPDCKVFLTSTRAGGLGINLTAADTVIIYDSDWVSPDLVYGHPNYVTDVPIILLMYHFQYIFRIRRLTCRPRTGVIELGRPNQ